MSPNKIPLLIYFLLSHIFLPCVLISMITFRRRSGKFDFWIKATLTALYITYFMLNGQWDLLFLLSGKGIQRLYYLKLFIPILFILVLGVGIIKFRKQPWFDSKSIFSNGIRVMAALLVITFLYIDFLTIKNYILFDRAVKGNYAFVDANVVTMENDSVLNHQTVIVSNGIISGIGPVQSMEIPENYKKIDSNGKYLIPGLMDMHTHPSRKEDLILFIANGVTTVRVMNGSDWHLKMKEDTSRDKVFGPEIFSSGPIVDSFAPSIIGLSNPEDADGIVKAQKDAGYDFIKVYDGLSPEVYNALGAASQKYNIKMTGHIPQKVNIDTIIKNKQYSIEHCVWNNLGDPGKLRDAGIWYCPTIVAFQQRVSRQEVENLLKQDFVKYAPPSTIQYWDNDFKMYGYDLNDTSRSREGMKQLGTLHAEGVRVLVGTDCSTPLVVPGYSIHQELRDFVQAGLSPFDALKACTRDSAEFLGNIDKSGTIKNGKKANLVLLDANPLEDIRNTSKSFGVMVNGKWFTSQELKKLLDQLPQSYIAEEAVRKVYNLTSE